MRVRKGKTSGGSDRSSGQEDTCQSIPRVAPSKVQQTTVKHNYEGLSSLPVVAHCDSVRHLYLSHNRIASLNGLQHYPNLTSLNASYNCLTKVAELRLLKRPELMDKLSLRMNRLEFGYQDFAVEVLPNLRRLEGAELNDKTIRREMARMREVVEKGLVEFYRRTELALSQLDREHDKQNKDWNGRNKMEGVRLEQRFWNKAKQLYIWPSEESLRQKSIQWLVSLCYEYLQLVNSADILTCHKKYIQKEWMEETREAGQQLCSAILLKFSSRNDHTLKQYLQSLADQGESALDCFYKLGMIQKQTGKGGVMAATSIDTNPAKYMQRLNNAELLNHPMNRLANWKLPQCRTLIPFEETKWEGFYKSPSVRIEPPLLEQISVFLYAKEYLEVVTEVILQQVGKLLAIEHRIKQAESEGTEIELKLSSSAMSFGHKDPQEFDDSLDHIIQQDIQNIIIPKPQSPPRKVEKQQEFSLNLQKYSIYQINLIFKALRSLKAAVKHKQ